MGSGRERRRDEGGGGRGGLGPLCEILNKPLHIILNMNYTYEQ